MYLCCIHAALIKQLYTDRHITAKEAAELTSKKLFKIPVASSSFCPIVVNASDKTTKTSSDFSATLCMRTVEATTNTTFSSANIELYSVSAVVSRHCAAVTGEHKALSQDTCTPSESLCVHTETSGTRSTKPMITSDINKVLHTKNSITTISLKNINGKNIPHQIPTEIANMCSSTMTNSLMLVHDVQESSPIEGKK